MTERADPRYRTIDRWDSLAALTAIWESQLAAVASVGPSLPALAAVVEAALPRLRAQGRLVYAGAGTSIRVAVQDGTELGPTFDWPDDRTVYLIAGGPQALSVGIEGAEDDTDDARAQVARAGIRAQDVVLGVAASGRTPFTVATIEAARAAGALTVAIACNRDTALMRAAEHAVLTETGSEVVAGSTRMKAGTAQKVVLNMISTQIMIGMGRVHEGQMVDMRAQNTKLRERACAMVMDIAGVSAAVAEDALARNGWRVKPAVLTAFGHDPEQARALLERAAGNLRAALAQGS